MSNGQMINDEGGPLKYFAAIPHIADDELDTYEYRLYGHYKRVCGERGGSCWESTRTTAARIPKFSQGMVTKVRKQLEEGGWIKCTEHESGTVEITLLDMWPRNMTKYAKCSPHEQERSPGEQERSPHELKKNNIRKTNEEQQPASLSEKSRAGKLFSNLIVSGVSLGKQGTASDVLAELEKEFDEETLVQALQIALNNRQDGKSIGSAYGYVAAIARNLQNGGGKRQKVDEAGKEYLEGLRIIE